MLGRRLLPQRTDDPGAGRVAVRLRLLRGKRLGTDDDHCFGRIDGARQILELGAIHVRHEVRRDIAAPFMAKRIANQQRTQVRAADADVDDVLESLARHSALVAPAHCAGEIRQLAARRVNFCLDVGAAGKIRAQCAVQDRTLLGGIDRIATKHRGPMSRKIESAREIEQQRQRLVGDALPGNIQQPVIVLDVKILPALRIGCG